MKFVRGTTSPSLVTTKGHYTNSKGKTSHHPPGKYSTNIDRRPPRPLKFVGVDGEGMDVNGTHKYVLFGVGERQISDSGGLRWSDVFEHLYSEHEGNKRDTAYVGFFLGYDFTQIFKTLPEDRARMLLTKAGREARAHRERVNGTLQHSGRIGMPPHPVEHEGWQFDMLGMKRLRLRPKSCDCTTATCKCKDKASWMYVCDVGSFFQTSFLKVIDPKGWAEGTEIVTPEEWDLIQAGKSKRSVAVLDDEMRLYNRLENVVLSRVMGVLDGGFRDIGVHLAPGKWFGPGQAAQTWLKNESVPTREDLTSVIPLRMFEAARASYFGGWFEIMMHGKVPGETHEYDINSAYPSIIAGLPCLLHGDYSHGTGLPPELPGAYTLVYANLESPNLGNRAKWKDQHIGAALHRDNGAISRPMKTEGWFWWHELKAAHKAKLIKRLDNRGNQKVEKWVQYVPCDCPPPMRNTADLYDKRLAVGKTSPLGKAAKLLYNSEYGKFAQSEGMNPIFGNPIYASLITAGCRTMILEAIASHPYGKADVAMVATDAVYFLHPHPTLPVSKKLGEWDYAKRENLTLFKPGVYWDDAVRARIRDGANPNFKARGFKASDFVKALARIDDEFEAWNTLTDEQMEGINRRDVRMPGSHARTAWKWPAVEFTPTFVMVTAVQALQRNKWETAGLVQNEQTAKPVKQDSDPYAKRTQIYREEYHGRTIYRTMPHSYTYAPSDPYDKHFGMEDPWSEEYRSQLGETVEGKIVDILSWILKGE